MLIKIKIQFLFFGIIFSAIIFSACNNPLGMGEPIDWEAPVLSIDPVPNPLYVKEWNEEKETGIILTGKVTDNVEVTSIKFTNTATGQDIFPLVPSEIGSEKYKKYYPIVIDGDDWSIKLKFVKENPNKDKYEVEVKNGDKIVVEIRAYDKMNNSDGNSVAIVTMIIDFRPPILEQPITIQRTDTKIARLEPLKNLQELETTDALGEKKDELYRYQNGWFYMSGVVNDLETKIEIISLDFYDVRYINDKLYSYDVDPKYTKYFPRWTIKEEDLINMGKDKWGKDYETNYYKKDGERYYYRVVIKAIDMGDNENFTDVTFEEDEGYICMWAKSDEPKGILDPAIGTAANETTIVSRGTPLPVDIFDDDSLDWAYTGLLTYEQWQGLNDVYSDGVKIPSTFSDEKKLEWLKERLRAGDTVYNWRFDSKRYKDISKDAVIAEQIEGKKLDELLVYVPTGNKEEDYGEFVLFSLVADKKLEPHDKTGPEDTNKDRWAGRVQRIQVIDENTPLIVFDTTKTDNFGGSKDFCPEENTFPTPLINGEYFNIVGYTLRENASGKNSVTKFRMAWIPYYIGMSRGSDKPDLPADDYIQAVQDALSNPSFAGMPDGVQYWEFVEGGGPQKGNFKNEGKEIIDATSIYEKQSFTKKFSVLGGTDDIKPDTKNFMYDYKKPDGKGDEMLGKDGLLDLENETKLFIFYAMDNMGHEVFRQLRLLGMKTPPDLSIYDISNKYPNENLPGEIGKPGGIPDPNNAGNIDVGTGIPTDAYYNTLKLYNDRAYANLRTQRTNITNDDKTPPFQIYPRATIVKYWVNAAKTGDIAVKTISMKDITFDIKNPNGTTKVISLGSEYNDTDGGLSFCEYFPDVTQRTFLFEATDKLGNIARVQRTIAVTNAARLENITTTTQNGTYGISNEGGIILKANFSSQIYVPTGRPLLSVRYKYKGEPGYRYDRIPCLNPPNEANPSLSLDFIFRVEQNFIGQLETTYEGMPYDDPSEEYNRPIVLTNALIMDYIRKDPAFVPGYKNESVTMPNWQNDANTLQKKKTIMLDGVRPVISSIAMSGKNAYKTTNDYYFKTGEAIELTLTADKPIRANSVAVNSTLKFFIRGSNGNLTNTQGYTLTFKYQKPGINNHMLVFSLPVTQGNIPFDGTLTDISLSGVDVIMDDVGNLVSTTILPTAPPAGENYYIKQAIPAVPAAELDGTLISSLSTTTTKFYKDPPTLVIPDSNAAAFAEWEDVKEYSLDGGMTWKPYTTSVFVPGGTHTIGTRYKDKAGNEGNSVFRKIEVEGSFPKLVSVNAVQANGYYKGGSTLTFNLNFAETVTVTTPGSVKITVRNRNTATSDSNETQDLTTDMASGTSNTTVTFNWPNINGKEMRDGLYISAVNISGLTDKFGNVGPSGGTATWSGGATGSPSVISIDNCPNLAAGIRVDTIAPSVTDRTPKHDIAPSGNASVTEIKLTFREPVMKGSGVITIRPRGNYAIPPVLRDAGYYLGTDGIEYPNVTTAPAVKKTYISSFYDIYNALNSATDRNALSQSTSNTNPSMSTLKLNDRTGQSYGPYKKMTQGLVEGYGYSGDYTGSDTDTISGVNAPDANRYTGMVPDTATKWVLDYQYSITGANSEVTAIRTALTNAKWRWQEIDVVNTSIGTGNDANIVTISLNEPLLKGLEWDVYYPAGAFTDMAGNQAAGSGSYSNGATTGTNSDYFFTSPGVQPPVIRVNRRTYDGRNGTLEWKSNTNRTYEPPPNTGGTWNTNAAVISDKGLPADTGWGIEDFNYVHYRVETESSAVKGGASITVQTFKGASGNKGGVTAAWSGNVQTATLNLGASLVGTNVAWTATAATRGTWVLSNLIRRAAETNTAEADRRYTVVTKYGVPETRTAQVGNPLRMFRSYNRDLTMSQLNGGDGVSLDAADFSNGQGVITFNSLEASKSYIVGSATCNGDTVKGYEGVFRTIIVYNYTNARADTNYIQIQGSNIKNGMPSVAGFPVRDAEETGDNRFIKVFFAAPTSATTGATNQRSYYWVSTEIVCEWYFLDWGGGGGTNGTHQNVGEVNNYFMVGYGDLTYGFNVSSSGGSI